MPTIRVELLPGRSRDQKREIAKGLTDVLVQQGGATPASVHVIFTEVDPSDWAVAGTLIAEREKA
ncbi:4-oxalocrotonate tautomerase family protein [Alcaligenaceae bacterium]|uniref:tautomerase family protein n=1 Tax=Parapusillimonas sp. JC17 TaxID=3445768 RepID=UPI0015D31F58|nr:4-oxalocrotonate tautomerase family protein [Alcaligenaceae bacterium]